MKINIKNELNAFCNKHGYTYQCGYNKKGEYEIIISQGEDNAGAFLSKEEIQGLTVEGLQSLLEVLHCGFKERFGDD